MDILKGKVCLNHVMITGIDSCIFPFHLLVLFVSLLCFFSPDDSSGYSSTNPPLVFQVEGHVILESRRRIVGRGKNGRV